MPMGLLRHKSDDVVAGLCVEMGGACAQTPVDQMGCRQANAPRYGGDRLPAWLNEEPRHKQAETDDCQAHCDGQRRPAMPRSQKRYGGDRCGEQDEYDVQPFRLEPGGQ